jgi:hypothetical protein
MEGKKKIFDLKNIVKAIKKIMNKNKKLGLTDLNSNFSRKSDSFFPLLSAEVNGSYENSGDLYNEAIRLYKFVKKNKDNIIDRLYSNKTDSETDSEADSSFDQNSKKIKEDEIIVLKKTNQIINNTEVSFYF